MMQQRTKSARVFVVGSFVAACCVKVDALPLAGESLAASAFSMEAGGKGLNLAVGARRLGADVDGLFAVGDDALSRLAAEALGRADLPQSMLVTLPGQTGSGVGFIGPDGENCLAVFSGANARLGPEHVLPRAEAICGSDIVLAQCEVGDAPIAAAFETARRAGARTLLNPSPFRSSCVDLLPLADIVCVNETEARALAAALRVALREPAALAEAVSAAGPEALVVTSGPAGATAYLRDPPHLVRQAGFRVDAVDTLGAGDAFAAALAVALAEGAAWPDALRRAAACGALVAATAGVFDALPRTAQVERLLSSQPEL